MAGTDVEVIADVVVVGDVVDLVGVPTFVIIIAITWKIISKGL